MRPAVFLVVGGIAIYLVLPSLLAVFGSWRSLEGLDWVFAALALCSELLSFVCLWELDRIALATPAWFPVVTAQLTGNALGRILPGGGATALATETSMLRRTGVETRDAVAALGAATGLQVGTALALPLVALPAILAGAPVNHSLATAAYLGAAVLVLVLAVGAAVFTSDAPLELAGRAIQWLLNSTVRRRRPVSGVSEDLLSARNDIRGVLGAHWRRALLAAAGNTAFDYLALLAALRAVGADPHPSLVLVAYTSAEVLALVPVTPGGLGFVEAGLVGMLTLAGVPAHDAVAATLLYRIVSFWLPIPAGGVAYWAFRRRYGDVKPPATSPPKAGAPTSTRRN